ncbi:MAG TPA: hypothetical protein VN133_13660, partial [Humibacter sp.]|nr:hypothetical protein [Humibacter sp.]
MSMKQRMISARDLDHLDPIPAVAKPMALWLWLNLDPLGRGPMDLEWIAEQTSTDPETALEHLLMLMEAGFLTTYQANGAEWLLLLHPLKADLRRTKIHTPEPPPDRPWTSVAVGGGARGRAREQARERARAEASARASA